ncbi:MAG: hypothetical protein K2P87_12990 [Lachnospiraceae bacterium]|nr:hypothetical protein [Lachnospiraceae bacterium]
MGFEDFKEMVARKTDDELRMEYFTFQALLAYIEPEWLDTMICSVANEINIAVDEEICRRFCGLSDCSEADKRKEQYPLFR